VEPGRFELPSKRATIVLSTCLVFLGIFVCSPVKNNQVTAYLRLSFTASSKT